MKFTGINDFEKATSLEWLETNGLGGYASSTVSGAHSRRYHGLLVAAMHPPVDRMVVLSKLEDAITIDGQVHELSSNQYPGAVHPQGYDHLTAFEREMFPVFHYSVAGVELKKTIAAIHDENTTLVIYEVIRAPHVFELELTPFCAARDFHSLAHANDSIGQQYLFLDGLFRTLNYHGCPELFISVPKSRFVESKHWYNNFEYCIEHYRGLDFTEDLYTHGKFSVSLKKGDKLGVIISVNDPTGRDAFKLFDAEKKRREGLVKNFSWNKYIKQLVWAADQFIVRRGELSTVIAGYHWFADWGRDTMIALPGLCLVTGRVEEAKQIIKQFAESVSDGMLPNRFPDHGEAPEYNTVDATLWFFHAIYKYYEYTSDKELVKSLLPVLKDIIEWHYKGTRYNIHVDPADELLYAGQDGVQLTWMDAKVGDWVVTQRKGKPVEINALWYNALCILDYLLEKTEQRDSEGIYRARAQKVLKSFNDQFWNEHQNGLYDYVDGDYKNDDLRPNQIYAVSLPFHLLDNAKAERVFETVSHQLLTAKGLKSLNTSNKQYCPIYGGGVWQRDGAYHQGTVWSFLLGPYIDALIAVKGADGKAEATLIVTQFLEHLKEGCVGSVSEIFDAVAPHHPRGCVAQAWGVGEVLRVALEYQLFQDPKKSK